MLDISGFSDEISDNFNEQLKLVTKLGMKYISIRGVDGKNFSDFTKYDVEHYVIPKLVEYGVEVSSIGSPLGKISVVDEEGFANQLEMVELLCGFAKMLECKYIRIFSFYIPQSDNPDDFREVVIDKLQAFSKVAEANNIILLHENEKDIFGDTAKRCNAILEAVGSKYFRGIFDFANFVQVGQDPIEAYGVLREYIDYIHIKDARFNQDANVVCGAGDGAVEELLQRFIDNGYQGFLTLEPHLAMFGMLQGLELSEVEKVIGDSNLTGAQGYELQYQALTKILDKIGASYA